jgi:hypothetical protein
MGEPKWTKGPWRVATDSNIGNLVEGPSGHARFEFDDGYRAIATVQACGNFATLDDEEENRAANLDLIATDPEIAEALAELLDASRECAEKADAPQDESDAAVDRLIEAENAAEAVLAKARGE